eukprot:gene12912-biopygen4857
MPAVRAAVFCLTTNLLRVSEHDSLTWMQLEKGLWDGHCNRASGQAAATLAVVGEAPDAPSPQPKEAAQPGEPGARSDLYPAQTSGGRLALQEAGGGGQEARSHALPKVTSRQGTLPLCMAKTWDIRSCTHCWCPAIFSGQADHSFYCRPGIIPSGFIVVISLGILQALAALLLLPSGHAFRRPYSAPILSSKEFHGFVIFSLLSPLPCRC